MSMRELNETLQPFRDAQGEGAIVFDAAACGQTPAADWFCPSHWGDAAQPVSQGGRGAAWFIDAGSDGWVLRHYLRGGLVARLSRDKFAWQGEDQVRSFAEFRLLQRLYALDLPVPRPVAAFYRRQRLGYRAAILLQRLVKVQTFAHWVAHAGDAAPWQEAGRLIARFHRVGLNHADLNAHNLLFDGEGKAWMIDFDKSRLQKPEAAWQGANLARLRRSLEKVAGQAATTPGFARLQAAYDMEMRA
ncbi:3-deoxy-D-manno-octulosonic acid kinase [Lysobacteraceae bacterium NML120232]|nr:3-deoxy-D-manno-octulosonic acid kinase [Xanthomonadaceae bacterium NML120232]